MNTYKDSADFELGFMLNHDELSPSELAELEAEKARLREELKSVRQAQPVLSQPKDTLRAGEKEELMRLVPVGNYVVTSPSGNRTVLEVRVAKSSGNQYVNIGQGKEKEYLGFSLSHLRLLAQCDLVKAAEDYKTTVREPEKASVTPVKASDAQAREDWVREQCQKRGLTDAQIQGVNMKWERDMAQLNDFYFPSSNPVQAVSDDRKAILGLLAASTHDINGREVELTDWKYRHASMEVAEDGQKYPSGEIEARILVGDNSSVLAMEETFDEAGNFAGYGFADSRENKSRLYPMLESVMGEEEYTEFLESGGSTVEKANEVFAPIVRESNEKLAQWVKDREHTREA